MDNNKKRIKDVAVIDQWKIRKNGHFSVLGRFYTIREAEAFIAGICLFNSRDCLGGRFGIDAPEEKLNPVVLRPKEPKSFIPDLPTETETLVKPS